MPTVILERGYRIVVYTNDHLPPHVHVIKTGHKAQFIVWNSEVELYENTNMTARELSQSADLCAKHYDRIVTILKEMPWVR